MPPRLPLPRIHRTTLGRFARYTVTFAIWFPAYIFFVDNVYSLERITGRSMAPNFCPDPTSKDYILAKHWGAAKDLQRGQVVMLRSPVDPERQVVKRIVGLEGDVVRTRHPFPQQLVAVPKGQLWVEGDEAFHSLDSNSYGPIPIALVTAKVTHIVFPISRLRAVPQEEGLSRRGALVKRAEAQRIDLFGL